MLRSELDELHQRCSDVAWAIHAVPPTEREELAHFLHLLRECKRMLSDAERIVETALADDLGDEKMAVVEGLGTLEKKHSPVKPRWDHAGLAKHLAALSRDERELNTETGEIEPEAEAALRVLLDVAAIDYYRLGKLKQRGLDPGDFREQDGWKPSVRIIR